MAVIARASDADAALAFIVACQADPATACAYIGDEPAGLTAELDGLEPPWRETLRVVTEGGRVVGAVCVEYDTEVGRSWIHGPWAPGRLAEFGEALIRTAAEQCPAEIGQHEICGDLANVELADLAARLGWAPTRANHVMTIPMDATMGWAVDDGVRPAVESDLADVARLHDAEFVGAYYSARQAIAEHTTVVVERSGRVVGYASGRIQDDGDAYVDFMAVDADHRGRGLGRALMGSLAAALRERGTPPQLNLTVDVEREPAFALYQSLGMTRECSIRGYRSSAST